MKNNYYLVCSSCLLLVSIIYYFCNFDYKYCNNCEVLLVFFLLLNLILSILFWRKAQYKSVIHKMDALFAKLSFVFFITYILFIKNNCYKIHKLILIFLIILLLLLFYLSNKYSKRGWCSRKHIIIHSIFHLFLMTGTLLSFI
jgi:hypothetical protein